MFRLAEFLGFEAKSGPADEAPGLARPMKAAINPRPSLSVGRERGARAAGERRGDEPSVRVTCSRAMSGMAPMRRGGGTDRHRHTALFPLRVPGRGPSWTH